MTTTTMTALLIAGPRRADWREVEFTDDRDIERLLDTPHFEYANLTNGLCVYADASNFFADGRASRAQPFVRVEGVFHEDGLVLHGEVLVVPDPTCGPVDMTPAVRRLIDRLFQPVAGV